MEARLRLFIVLVATLLVANNLLPYVGLRDDSCQTMFSGLRWWPGGNNHHLMPQSMVSDFWRFYVDVSAELDPPAPEHGRAADLLEWLNREGREKNIEAIRAVVRQLCDRGHRVELTYRFSYDDGPAQVAQACDDPVLSDPHALIPIRLHDSDYAVGPPQ